MDFIPEEIMHYCEAHTEPESTLLSHVNRYTQASVLMPRMLAGHLQGRMIAMFSQMIRPKTVVEIGTYTGYSALCWAEGFQSEGRVHTIELNDELETTIRSHFDQSPFSQNLKLHIGNALDILPTLEAPFDIVYIDADKENYIHYFDAVIDKVPSGGYIIADNVLWSGKVCKPAAANDLETKTLQEYAAKIHNDPRVESLMLPVRDGWLIARKR